MINNPVGLLHLWAIDHLGNDIVCAGVVVIIFIYKEKSSCLD